jgi:hypothetical protein
MVSRAQDTGGDRTLRELMARTTFPPASFAVAIGVLCTGLACGGGSAADAGGGADGGGLSGAAGGVGGVGGAGGGFAGTGGGVAGAGGAVTAVGQFMIVYDGAGGPYTSNLTTCLDCMAWYNSGSDTGAMTFAMANAAGAPYRTMVSVYVTHGFAAEYAVGVNWLEDNPSLPAMYQGLYYFADGITETQVTPTACVTLTSADLRFGGGAAGSFDCTFGGGPSTNRQTARMRGSFSGVFPE